MLCNIKYVYDKSKEEKRVLLGAKLYFDDGDKIRTQEIYVGLPFVLEDIMESEINAKVLGVRDKSAFAERYNNVKAAGVVYFPQSERSYFLEDGDEVLLWNGEARIAEILEARIAEYKSQELADGLQQKIATKRQKDSSFPYSSLAESYEPVPVRQRYSNR